MNRKSTPAAGKGRNLQLDILRGIAILLVLGAHFDLQHPAGPLRHVAEFWQNNGLLGVDLFFVLSGFLIGGLLVSEHTKHGKVDVVRFLVRRGFKIYPLYFIFIGYLMLMPAIKGMARGENPASIIAAGFHDYWPNLLFLHTYIGENPAGHTWSLANEEHFYIILPLIIWWLSVKGRMRQLEWLALSTLPLFIGIRVLSIHLGDPYAEKMVASHLRLDGLFFGVWIRAIAEYRPAVFAGLRRWRGVLLVAGVLLWIPALFHMELGRLYGYVGFTCTMFGSGAFLIALYHTHAGDFGRWHKLVSPLARGMAFVGFYSYAIYLFHVTAIRITEKNIIPLIHARFDGANPAVWVISAMLAGLASIIAGVVASRMVELPMIRLRDRFYPSGSPAAGMPGTNASREEHFPARPQALPREIRGINEA